MKEKTDKEKKIILFNANFPAGLSFNQTVKILWWAIFNRKRFDVFIRNIERGKSLNYSLKDATELTFKP